MNHPAFSVLGHATGRLLLKCTGYDIDLERIARHAKDVGCYFEINADPDRLDLSADYVRQVAAAGVKIAICADARRAGGLDYLKDVLSRLPAMTNRDDLDSLTPTL